MCYAKRPKINWAKALANPRDYELLQHERSRKAYADAWKESSNESDGRVCILTQEGLPASAYDHRAQMIYATAPSNATLRSLAGRARHQRQAKPTPQGNRHKSGTN